MNQQEIQERLIFHNIRPSVQRMAIMGYLMSHSTHPTVDMIYNDLYPDMPTLSKTTVYNTLNLLTQRKAAKMLTIDEKNTRYDGDITEHAHFRCRNCGGIKDIKLGEIEKMFQIQGLQVDEMEVYCKGYCDDCRKLLDKHKV